MIKCFYKLLGVYLGERDLLELICQNVALEIVILKGDQLAVAVYICAVARRRQVRYICPLVAYEAPICTN